MNLTQPITRTALLGAVACGLTLPLAAQTDTRPAWADSLDAIVGREMARTRTPGVSLAVVVDGRVAYAQGYGVTNVESSAPVTRETLFRVGSVTKMFTGALLAQLEVAKILDLEAPIGQYIPEISGRVASVNTRQLLTHHAGWLDNAVAYGRMGESALGEVMREVTDTLFFTDPGAVYSYSNPGYSMAGYVAEVAGKSRYATLMERMVLRPSGMERATFKPLVALTYSASQGHQAGPGGAVALVRPFTENTAQWAAGFLMASAEEVARFTTMLMDSGRVNGTAVLDPGAVSRVTTRYVTPPGAPAADTVGYGLGLMISHRGGHTMWQHGGSINGFDANVVMLPEQRASVVLIDNLSGAPLNGVIDAALRLATGHTPSPPPPVPARRAATAAERAALVGRYAMGGRVLTITDENGELRGTQGGGGSVPVLMVGTDGIVLTPPGGAPMSFATVPGPDGRVRFLFSGGRALARQER
jgi:CubicO group peptidase (beta-lactamase class C family)